MIDYINQREHASLPPFEMLTGATFYEKYVLLLNEYTVKHKKDCTEALHIKIAQVTRDLERLNERKYELNKLLVENTRTGVHRVQDASFKLKFFHFRTQFRRRPCIQEAMYIDELAKKFLSSIMTYRRDESYDMRSIMPLLQNNDIERYDIIVFRLGNDILCPLFISLKDNILYGTPLIMGRNQGVGYVDDWQLPSTSERFIDLFEITSKTAVQVIYENRTKYNLDIVAYHNHVHIVYLSD